MPMASLISVPKCFSYSSSFTSCHLNTTPTWMIPPFSQWTGLKQHLGISISISPKYLKPSHFERKARPKGSVVRASLFGVGAPEALVIGVVALLVFGPKGLAEVARNLGKTLRAFQPTIKELQEVSREFKSTLQREIGLDDLPIRTQNTYRYNRTNTASTRSPIGDAENSATVADPNGAPSPNRAYTSEEYLKITDEQLKASASQQQGQSPSTGESPSERQTQPQPQGSVKETVGTTPPLKKPESEV